MLNDDDYSFNPQIVRMRMMEEEKLRQLEQIQKKKEELKKEEVVVHHSKVMKPSAINSHKKPSSGNSWTSSHNPMNVESLDKHQKEETKQQEHLKNSGDGEEG